MRFHLQSWQKRDGVGFGVRFPALGSRIHELAFEALLHAPDVGIELRSFEFVLFPIPENDPHVFRSDALNQLEKVAVHAELEDDLGVNIPGELRIPDLIAPVAELRRRGPPEEKVGVADPWVDCEQCLHDHFGAAVHRIERLLARLVERDLAAVRNDDDLLPLVLQLLDIVALVLTSMLDQELSMRRAPHLRRLDFSEVSHPVERDAMLTPKEVRQICGREGPFAVVKFHVTVVGWRQVRNLRPGRFQTGATLSSRDARD